MSAVRRALRRTPGAADRLSVVICRRPCVVEYSARGTRRAVSQDAWPTAGLREDPLPAVGTHAQDGRAQMDPTMCRATVAAGASTVLPAGAIAKEGE